jgi:hypothetical protein
MKIIFLRKEKVHEVREFTDRVLEGIIKIDFELPKWFSTEKEIRDLNFMFEGLNILFYRNKENRYGFTRGGNIFVNLEKANTNDLVKETITHEMIHRVQFEKSKNKHNIDKIKASLLQKKEITKKDLEHINYPNYFELMAYAYTFANSGIDIREVQEDPVYKILTKGKRFKKYLYLYYKN